MTKQPDTLAVLLRVSTEIEASLIIQRLENYGINATAVGGLTTGFRAEAPGTVSVMVKSADLFAAQTALATIREESSNQPSSDDDEDEEKP